ncbi:MAG: hypothetical protein J2P43_07785 [Candidatus Dormibacteraeota bacterium]|nr:hypothetical protein [Candidatus Dormibacteraeota bacterium]
MSPIGSEYWLAVFRMEQNERLRAARMGRLAASLRATSPLRRRFGSALVRLGVLVGGPTVARSSWLVPAHHGGTAR